MSTSSNNAANVERDMTMTSAVSRIVAAYVGNNVIPQAEIPALIASVHRALGDMDAPVRAPAALVPAVPVRRSVTPEYIVCLEDGKKFKSLKRHLRSRYDMTPEQYRSKWKLPTDYPMVASNYAKRRSELAKNSGLGNSKRRTSSKSPS